LLSKQYDGEVRRVQDLLDQLDKSGLADSPQAHVRLWFRGHSTAEWELRPGVYRPNFPAENEAERLKTERHLTQDFRVQSSALRIGRETEPELYFLQQHYRMPTRLLDWTTSPLHGLHFAVTASPGSAAEVYMMDAYQLAHDQKAKDFLGIATARHSVFEKALFPIFRWQGEDNFPDFILPVRPDYFDRRINLQRSCFTFHVPHRSVLTKSENKSLRMLLIPKDAKEQIKKELFLLGIDEFTVFGDLESLSSRLKTAYKLT
jgi:hypothetical protein